MKLTIDGVTKVLKEGDRYFIGKDVVHAAKIKAGYKGLAYSIKSIVILQHINRLLTS